MSPVHRRGRAQEHGNPARTNHHGTEQDGRTTWPVTARRLADQIGDLGGAITADPRQLQAALARQ